MVVLSGLAAAFLGPDDRGLSWSSAERSRDLEDEETEEVLCLLRLPPELPLRRRELLLSRLLLLLRLRLLVRRGRRRSMGERERLRVSERLLPPRERRLLSTEALRLDTRRLERRSRLGLRDREERADLDLRARERLRERLRDLLRDDEYRRRLGAGDAERDDERERRLDRRSLRRGDGDLTLLSRELLAGGDLESGERRLRRGGLSDRRLARLLEERERDRDLDLGLMAADAGDGDLVGDLPRRRASRPPRRPCGM